MSRSPEAALVEVFTDERKERLLSQCAKMPDGARMDPDKLIGQAVSAMKRNKKLGQCNPATVAGAVFSAASLGLSIDGISGEAYLVPYKQECQLQIGFKGFVKLAFNSGKVRQFTAHPVYEADEFKFEYGTNQHLKHVPAIAFGEDERGDVVAAWALVDYTGGGKDFEVLQRADIDKIRANSSGYNYAESGPTNRGGGRKDSVWHKYYAQMAAKSAIRRLAKHCPLSPEFVRAGAMDERGDVGQQHLAIEVPGLPELEAPPEPASEEAALRDSLPEPKGDDVPWDDGLENAFPPKEA